ncbi:metal-dependent hydrolase [Luteipulveratus flavus]|uniref:Metal-dependent hydrolase n=1 Tax=Luteipulveratus flavus TaxID=3031728 RepID=A0ABT6C3N4_9MICO|nr:metal-dependent hydrolase [Luteipulveratus sp. YIM 133296]MDF8263569.1 metal-dependent hydrolase [Luteipulveratus sp. YIM 133296]
MGRTHALSGWCAGLGVAYAVDVRSLHQSVLLAATTAGFALLPDLDHPGASASRLLGPVTALLCRILRALSAAVYALTKGPRDEKVKGKHRHLTHTLLFAIGLWYATDAATDKWGPTAVGVVVLSGLLLAEAVLGDWVLFVAGAGVIAWLGTAGNHVADLQVVSGWLGLAVAAGCVTHCIGDALTKSGCPFLFPVPIAGETWYEIRPPKALRFTTGTWVENGLIAPLLIIGGVLLLPGVWTTYVEPLTAAFD